MFVRLSTETSHRHVGSEQMLKLLTQLLQVCVFKTHVLFIPDNTTPALAANALHTRNLCKVYNIGANLPCPACPDSQMVRAQTKTQDTVDHVRR
jgi:hypothetical protein